MGLSAHVRAGTLAELLRERWDGRTWCQKLPERRQARVINIAHTEMHNNRQQHLVLCTRRAACGVNEAISCTNRPGLLLSAVELTTPPSLKLTKVLPLPKRLQHSVVLALCATTTSADTFIPHTNTKRETHLELQKLAEGSCQSSCVNL